MHKIQLENVRIYTNHGCLLEEDLIGSEYRVDLQITADLSKSAQTDELLDTVDYVSLHAIIVEEMAVRSKLLEHVAQRILNRIFKEESLVEKAEVKVAKINPPIGGDVQSVVVIMSQERIESK
ncbi:dihydroneopterin aldolase [Nonlabens sp. MB-3u-79]|jgi:dihydroneopterin aldolase|uniref:dihydroneopterin aldolase n=1 Tax=Nonlabens sp. MB-3u-79 TaxID=2058134 RepID=UPI000C312A53|nr:dihydroneopterin aldolase [Nonlabens sp. MB-3u-79]AUC78678.1 dihydroneopterin aldolase [Nonlabens sp. MB-3u-79]|tara:strand:+ start:23971 stop:24339 length:369 start_codon:yes stop_codon:yes gene_type:complete